MMHISEHFYCHKNTTSPNILPTMHKPLFFFNSPQLPVPTTITTQCNFTKMSAHAHIYTPPSSPPTPPFFYNTRRSNIHCNRTSPTMPTSPSQPSSTISPRPFPMNVNHCNSPSFLTPPPTPLLQQTSPCMSSSSEPRPFLMNVNHCNSPSFLTPPPTSIIQQTSPCTSSSSEPVILTRCQSHSNFVTKEPFTLATLYKNKIFVGSLLRVTTPGELVTFFKKFGIVTEAKVVLDREGNSRGYGFVTFTSIDSVNSVLSAGSIYLGSRRIAVASAIRKKHPDEE